jgi:hypothetical protein|tara:strand:+ start:276 stop:470 length:195 start_codon:yes stop_codon:yes gene_type:complete
MAKEKINAMIKDITNKNLIDAETKYQSVMNDKIAAELGRAKETLSKTIFNDKGQLDLAKTRPQE